MTLAVLSNFPNKSQLTEATKDGKPPENKNFDCVPVVFADAIQYYDGGYVSGDELKDAEYGDKYIGGTALRDYIDQASDLARAKYHVTAVPYNNANTIYLRGKIHTWLQAGYPVIATIPSAWSIGHPMDALAHPNFSTHAICFYGEIAGGLVAANPWGGFAHKGTDAYWQERLCYGQVWAVVREANVATAGLPDKWTDDGKTLKSPDGIPVVQGFRDFVLAYKGGWPANNTPLAPERVVSAGSIEYGNASVGPGSRQDFRFCSLGWTQAWNVYVIAVGQDVTALAQQVSASQTQIASLTAQLAAAQAAAANAPKPDLVANNLLAAVRAAAK